MLLCFSSATLSEIAVIVHPSNNNILSKTDIAKIYLGKKNRFPDKSNVKPLNLPKKSSTYAEFIETVLNKPANKLNTYWARLMFTAKGMPPEVVANTEIMLQRVSSAPNAIGYVDASQVSDKVKVVGRF